MADEDLRQHLRYPTDERLWALAEALRRGWDHETVYELCKVDHWFLQKLTNLLGIEQRLIQAKETAGRSEPLLDLVKEAFLIGFPSPSILNLMGLTPGVQKAIAEVLAVSEKPLDDLPEEPPVMLPGIGVVSVSSSGSTALKAMERLRAEAGGLDPAFLMEAARAVNQVKVEPVFKMVDTCAGEFESATPYYYSTFEQENDFLAGSSQG
ncbi:MAG: hypothetical protein MUC92_04485 [Fimbriimonadaceae bacterium]|nr:hypothetical protein [Fimbriimonadaceae bacterium]